MEFKICELRSYTNINNNSKVWDIVVLVNESIEETLIIKREIYEIDMWFIEKLKKCTTIKEINTLHNPYYDKKKSIAF